MFSVDPILQRLRYRVQSKLPLLFPGALCRIEDETAVAITIDDGPSTFTTGLLERLDSHAMLATFFLSGSSLADFPGRASELAKRGHAVASHGFLHEDLALKPRSEVRTDLVRGLEAVEAETGVRPKYYRPPYGRLNPMHRDLPAQLGCSLVLWTALPGDFDPTVKKDELQRRIGSIRGGDIIVLHDQPHAADRTTACIEFIAELLRRKSLRTVTLS